jgi:peptidoglycan-associated lipoprotein
MKSTLLLKTVALAALLAVGAVGCRKAQKPHTPIPKARVAATTQPNRPGPIGGGQTLPDGGANPAARDGSTTSQDLTATRAGTPQPDIAIFDNMRMDTNAFAAATAYFDYDSSTVKSSEKEKVDSVADHLKLQPTHALRIDGHCDERGTEEYNRALGERRALALREYLIGKGVAADRIRTMSWGEDRPADLGHDDTAWSRNRRGEFILLLPLQ